MIFAEPKGEIYAFQNQSKIWEALFQVLEDVPNEICDLVPQRVCNQVTKLVPKLVPKRKCVDEPNEVCIR